jgi:hypothetical protein
MKNRTKQILIALAMLLTSCGLFFGLKLFHATAQTSNNPLFPPEMNEAKLAKSDFVIGDLGGIPVKIPHYFAHYVEYDGDPGFGEKRKGERPIRNYQSKLMSFGFKVRIPDMAGLSSPELNKDFQNQSIYETPWISVGFNTGSIYPGDGALDRRTKYQLSFDPVAQGFPALRFDKLEQLLGKEYGLTVYAASGIDPQTQKPYRQDPNARDLFIARDAQGHVVTHIRCSNRKIHSAPCEHGFSMEPKMRALLYIQYRRGMLPQWQLIQKNVTQLVWSFQANAADVALPVSDR